MRDGFRIVDADGHVIEPDGLWEQRIDPQHRDAAPRMVGLTFGFEFAGTTVNLPDQWSPGETPEQTAHRAERILATYAELYPDAFAAKFDAESQLEAMDREGVDVAFLYPSFGLFVLAMDGVDDALAVAVARTYNDWLAEFCAADPQRLRPVAMVALQDPEAAADEAARAADELGARGIFLRPNPVRGRNLDDPAYDRLWGVLSDRRMALGLHEGGFPRLPQVVDGRLTDPEQIHICTHPMEQMIAAVSLIYGGVCERFPGLRVAFLEAGCGWVPFWLHRMDEHWENSVKKDYGARRSLEVAPSEIFRRQCYVSTDADESMLAQVIELIGEDRIVFSTDYPHPDSQWPHAVEAFLALPGVTDDTKRKILWDNALALYELADAAVAAPATR